MTSDVTYRLRSGTHVESFWDSSVLFSEEQQQIHRLNDSASAMISRLKEGATADELTAALEAAGLEQTTAEDGVRSLLGELGRMRLVEGRLTRELAAPFAQTLQLAGLVVELRYFSEQLRSERAPAFSHLESSKAAAVSLEIHDCGSFVFIGTGGEAFDVVDRTIAAIWLKGMVLEAVLDNATYLAALHSACVIGNTGALLLLGAPGAGKTALTLALMQKGYLYGSDDVTLVTTDSKVCGVALAPAVKEPAWDISRRLGRDLSQATTHLRPDGQKARFVSVSGEEVGKC